MTTFENYLKRAPLDIRHPKLNTADPILLSLIMGGTGLTTSFMPPRPSHARDFLFPEFAPYSPKEPENVKYNETLSMFGDDQ